MNEPDPLQGSVILILRLLYLGYVRHARK